MLLMIVKCNSLKAILFFTICSIVINVLGITSYGLFMAGVFGAISGLLYHIIDQRLRKLVSDASEGTDHF